MEAKCLILHGDCLSLLPTLPSDSVDSIVTDPPYEIGMLSKAWDKTGIAFNVNLWREALRCLKPGGHLLSFSSTRTYHRMVCAIEDAGFEIRDQIGYFFDASDMAQEFLETLTENQRDIFSHLVDASACTGQLSWVYGSGFPKSLNVGKAIDQMKGAEIQYETYHRNGGGYNGKGKHIGQITTTSGLGMRPIPSSPEAQQWDGWGTALKPAHEPICLARKPLSEPTMAENVLKWGTGALNVDGCRIPTNGRPRRTHPECDRHNGVFENGFKNGCRASGETNLGRWPANCLFDEDAAQLLDQTTRSLHATSSARRVAFPGGHTFGGRDMKAEVGRWYNDSGGASRFFYVAKASTSERNLGIPKVYDLKPDTPPEIIDRIKMYLEAMK